MLTARQLRNRLEEMGAPEAALQAALPTRNTRPAQIDSIPEAKADAWMTGASHKRAVASVTQADPSDTAVDTAVSRRWREPSHGHVGTYVAGAGDEAVTAAIARAGRGPAPQRWLAETVYRSKDVTDTAKILRRRCENPDAVLAHLFELVTAERRSPGPGCFTRLEQLRLGGREHVIVTAPAALRRTLAVEAMVGGRANLTFDRDLVEALSEPGRDTLIEWLRRLTTTRSAATTTPASSHRLRATITEQGLEALWETGDDHVDEALAEMFEDQFVTFTAGADTRLAATSTSPLVIRAVTATTTKQALHAEVLAAVTARLTKPAGAWLLDGEQPAGFGDKHMLSYINAAVRYHRSAPPPELEDVVAHVAKSVGQAPGHNMWSVQQIVAWAISEDGPTQPPLWLAAFGDPVKLIRVALSAMAKTATLSRHLAPVLAKSRPAAVVEWLGTLEPKRRAGVARDLGAYIDERVGGDAQTWAALVRLIDTWDASLDDAIDTLWLLDRQP